MERPTVLLALRSALFADALAEALSEAALDVVGRAQDLESALEEARRLDPAAAVVSADLPGGGLATCAGLMKDENLRTMTMMIGDPGSAEEMMAALEAGALGYATSSTSLTDLVADLCGVVNGEARVPRLMLGGLLRGLVARERKGSEMIDRYAALSKRERQTLGLLARGHDHLQIAATLFISPETARTHIQNVLGKLEVHSRLEAAALALENGWVNLEATVET